MPLKPGNLGGQAIDVDTQESGMNQAFLEQIANQRFSNGYKIQRIVFEPGKRAMVVVWERFR